MSSETADPTGPDAGSSDAAGLSTDSAVADVAQAEIDRLVAFVARLSALSPSGDDLEAAAAAQDRNRAAFEAMNDAMAAKALEAAYKAIAEMRSSLQKAERPTPQSQAADAAARAEPTLGAPVGDALREIDALRDYEVEVLLRRFEREALGAEPAKELGDATPPPSKLNGAAPPTDEDG